AGEDGAEGAVATAMTSIIVPQNHVQCRQFNVGSAIDCTDGTAPIRDLALMTSHAKLITAALTAATVFSAIPAVSQADVTFGSRLDHEPSNSAPAHNCREDGSDDPTPTCTRVAIDQSFAVSGGLVAPMDGKIVRFRVRAGAPGTLTLKLAQLQNAGFTGNGYSAQGRSAGTGPTVNVQGRGFDENEADAVETVPAGLTVHKGDYVGIDSTSTSALYCSHGGASQAIFTPALGDAFQTSTKTDGCELMVQADMVPTPPASAKTTAKHRKHRKHHRKH